MRNSAKTDNVLNFIVNFIIKLIITFSIAIIPLKALGLIPICWSMVLVPAALIILFFVLFLAFIGYKVMSGDNIHW